MKKNIVLALIMMVDCSNILSVDVSDQDQVIEKQHDEYDRWPRGFRGHEDPRGDQGHPGQTGAAGPQGIKGPTGPAGGEGEDPPFTATKIVQVNKAGDDSIGDGSDEKPFLTIGHAMSAITDAAPSKRYEILVGPGTYAEDVALKANVFIVGFAPILTRVNSININDTSWTVNQDSRSGLKNLQVLNTTTLDFASTQSSQGKMYLFQCRLSGDVDYTGCNSINEVLFYNCELQSNLNHQGGDVLWYSSIISGNIVIVDPIPDAKDRT